ncbi:MAG: ornithine carbamoyltransferase [Candidatus Omnitrophica bacterium]|nr:ornithine carbamoyltransferase [Candidatus Omnitrophota bacterium]
MKKDLVSIKDLTAKEIKEIFDLTDKLKKDAQKYSRTLSGNSLALIFQKPSNRTRVSFQVGMYQLGGYSLYLAPQEINLGVRESIRDVAKTLSRYVQAIVFRTFEHKNVTELARAADIPVINALSDFEHPCQALADIYTVREKLKRLKGLTLAFVGDGNNVCNSLLYAAAKVGLNMHVGSPAGYTPDSAVVGEAKAIARTKQAEVKVFDNPTDAVRGAHVVYTDVWTSMGQEKEAQERKKIFREFQINKNLARLAHPKALIMHCLPAHRGEEITDEMMDSPNSVIFDQAENRMHVQKAILIKLLK